MNDTQQKHTFRAKVDLVKETSYGIIDQASQVEIEVTIGINSDDYGWFEIYDIESGGIEWYAEGGLWFDNKVVTDYDGVFTLSHLVIEKLEELGYDCTEVK